MSERRENCFMFSPTLDIVRIKCSCQFKCCARVSHCGMILISLITVANVHFVIALLAIWLFAFVSSVYFAFFFLMDHLFSNLLAVIVYMLWILILGQLYEVKYHLFYM